jgi:exopolysaccharide biosynthesis polyprenyl glycosylphosphotransferase
MIFPMKGIGLRRLKAIERPESAVTPILKSKPRSSSERLWLSKLWQHRSGLVFFLDANIIFWTFLAAYALRFHLWAPGGVSEAQNVPPLVDYVKASALLTILWCVLLWRAGTYSNSLLQVVPFTFGIRRLFTSGVIALGLLMIISFSYRPLLLSRLVYCFAFLGAMGLLIAWRLGLRVIDCKLAESGIGVLRTLLVGTGRNASAFLDRLENFANMPGEVVGFVLCDKNETPATRWNASCRCLGIADEIPQIYASTPFDRLVIASENLINTSECAPNSNDNLVSLLNFCETKGIAVYLTPSCAEIIVSRSEAGSFFGMPVLLLRDGAIHPVYQVVKRLMDIILSATVIVLGLPVWIAIAILVKVTSEGPVLYAQERVGLHNKPFTMYKFRSMVHNADEKIRQMVDFDNIEEPVFNIRQDTRITPIGKILRRTSLDEIPQFINVLLGSMSVVGPRPERTELVKRYSLYHMRRLKAKPGITGYQQVLSRGDPSLAKRIEYDLFYLKYQSLWLDLIILFKTVVVVFRGDGMK